VAFAGLNNVQIVEVKRKSLAYVAAGGFHKNGIA
jgi:hypothetical protein